MDKITANKESSNKSWLGALFGLIFVAAGLFAAYFSAGSMIFRYLESSDWEQVPADIQQIELVHSRGSDSTTYKVTGVYHYEYFGQAYTSRRISLSKGSDNIGSYWQDLYRKLRSQQRGGTVTAWVNPDNPDESYLDRTLRWSSILFGSMFLLLFGGIGGALTWVCLRTGKSQQEKIVDAQLHGVSSDQKYGSWALAAFGGVFFVMGAGMGALILPEELAKGNYAALLVLLFAAVGAAIIGYALKIRSAYKRFGPTPLFLSPLQPSLGGQLGGSFTIKSTKLALRASDSQVLEARLSCSRKRKSGDNTRTSILWQETAPVFLERNTYGLEARFLFEIPENASPTEEWSNNSSVEWSVNVEGDFSDIGYGEFSRDWEVSVYEHSNDQTSNIHIPQSFLEAAQTKTSEKARQDVLTSFPLNESMRYLDLVSESGRYVGTCIGGMLFGVIFAAIGFFTLKQDWWPGYVFVAMGTGIGLSSLFTLGRSIELKIDKHASMLYTRRSWFGVLLSKKEAAIFKPEQFELKRTSSSQTGDKLTEYFSLYLQSNGKKIKIAEGIKSKRAAQALLKEITDRLFRL